MKTVTAGNIMFVLHRLNFIQIKYIKSFVHHLYKTRKKQPHWKVSLKQPYIPRYMNSYVEHCAYCNTEGKLELNVVEIK